jgi:hypothetical protein
MIGLTDSASEAAINDMCKKLSRQWHPDKFKARIVLFKLKKKKHKQKLMTFSTFKG